MTLSNPSANAMLGDASGIGTIRDDELNACGEPLINPAVDREAFLWQDCATGIWSALFTPGGVYTRYRGTIDSDQGFTSVIPISIESKDTLTNTGTQLSFDLGVGQAWTDGFEFTVPGGSNLCVGLDLPAGINVLVGELRTPVTVPFNPNTLGPCP
jgi:hypothetical protein